jgi:hypothetical protein
MSYGEELLSVLESLDLIDFISPRLFLDFDLFNVAFFADMSFSYVFLKAY